MAEKFDDVIHDFIDFINRQVGVYMDSMAGFAKIKLKTEFQIHRVNRRQKVKFGDDGIPEVTWVTYEDETKPDVIHNRIVRTQDYVAANSPNGSNEQQHAQAILVFLFTYWEDSIRQRLADAKGVDKNSIRSNVMGDLRIVRSAILHARSRINPTEFKRMKSLTHIFKPDGEVAPSYEDMHEIFIQIKRDAARLLFDWLGIKNPPISPDEIISIAIQRRRRD